MLNQFTEKILRGLEKLLRGIQTYQGVGSGEIYLLACYDDYEGEFEIRRFVGSNSITISNADST